MKNFEVWLRFCFEVVNLRTDKCEIWILDVPKHDLSRLNAVADY